MATEKTKTTTTTIKAKDLNKEANLGKKKTSGLQRFYISEKWDTKDKENIYFNFKMANSKNVKKFTEFLDAVKEFIAISQTTNNNTRVWFHRDGAYRGSVNVDKAKVIVQELESKKVENKNAINFLQENNLVDMVLDEKPEKIEKKEEPKVDLLANVPEVVEKTQFVVIKDPTVTAVKEEPKPKDKWSILIWTLAGILIFLIVLNILLIILGATKVI